MHGHNGPHGETSRPVVEASPLDPTLLRIPEACARLRISRATLYRELSRGRLRTVGVGPSGRARRVHVKDLEEYERRVWEEAAAGR